MSATAVGALTRASWLQARSYRVSFTMQVAGLVLTVIPIYFIAGALQSTMSDVIAVESGQFFSFVLVGSIAMMFVSTALATLQGTIASGISTGYFESLLMTRTPVPWIALGLSSYGFLLTSVRALVMLTAGWVLGAEVAWHQSLSAIVIITLLYVVHFGIGLIASALVIAFRSSGPLIQLVAGVSVFFGGVYYPVSAIPSWLRNIADLTPLSYGLRALRRALLRGDGLSEVSLDLAMLVAMSVVLLTVGGWAIAAALRYAKKSGSLGSY